MIGTRSRQRGPRAPLGLSVATVFLLSMGLVATGCAVDTATDEDEASAAQSDALTIPMIFANAATGSCMDASASWAGTLPVSQRACDGRANQRFSRSGDASWFALRDAAGRCLQVTATSSGTALTRATCAPGALPSAQRFALGPLSPGPKGMARTLRTATGLCVDGAATPFVGMPLRVSPCNGAVSQLWSVLEGPATP